MEVRLADVDHGWKVQIDDDGDGFDPPDSGSVPGYLGLTAMRERAQIAGGWWKMECTGRLSSLFQHPLGRGQAGKAPDSGSGNS